MIKHIDNNHIFVRVIYFFEMVHLTSEVTWFAFPSRTLMRKVCLRCDTSTLSYSVEKKCVDTDIDVELLQK